MPMPGATRATWQGRLAIAAIEERAILLGAEARERTLPTLGRNLLDAGKRSLMALRKSRPASVPVKFGIGW